MRYKRQLTNKLFLLGLLLCSSCSRDYVKTEELIIKPTDSITQIVITTEEKHISNLHLSIEGEINGSGRLIMGNSDSTIYRTYELSTGEINLTYNGDWYAEFCYLTYKPTSKTSGQLKIKSDFVGTQR